MSLKEKLLYYVLVKTIFKKKYYFLNYELKTYTFWNHMIWSKIYLILISTKRKYILKVTSKGE